MKTFLLILLGIGSIILGITAFYFPALLTREDAFAERFLSSLEETVPGLEKTEETISSLKNGSIEVPILVYHSVRPSFAKQTKIMREYNVPPETFTKQLQYLKDNNYNVISLNALANYFSKEVSLPAKPVILTFDDGWANQYKHAFPILKKFGFTATFFIYTNAINKKHFLTWDQIKEMTTAGMTIDAHTKSHPYLIKISMDTAQLRDEIIGGKKVLEEHLGTPVEFFAYPFGHYNDAILKIVKEAGFALARSTYPGIYQTQNNLYTLHGNQVTENFDQFIEALTQTNSAPVK